jgi:hypothetical protein
MHLHTYRDESRSRHLNLIVGRGHRWSIDLVAATASGILVLGFACASQPCGSTNPWNECFPSSLVPTPRMHRRSILV